nr:FTR1 family protein [Synechococcus sp. PCC 7336]
MDWSPAIPAFVVTLREGVEAALAVGIVLAYLNRVGRQQLYRWVYAGIGAGVAGSVVVGLLLRWGITVASEVRPEYAPALEPLLEGAIGTIAIVLLSWMLVWMAKQAKQLKGETERAVTAALDRDRGAALGIASLVCVAVLREGFELALFLLAQVQQGWMSVTGAIAGLGGAVAFGLLLFRWGIRINIGRFFQVMGVLLLAIVAGLVVSALADFDEATLALSQLQNFPQLCRTDSPVCWLGPQVWNLHEILPQRQFPGMVLRSLLGYTDRLYLMQAIAYGGFWAIVGGLYTRSLGSQSPTPPPTTPTEGEVPAP